MKKYPFIAHNEIAGKPELKEKKLREFLQTMKLRRSVRDIDPKPIPRKVIEDILTVAGSAPSGANKQPWTFCVVRNQDIKRRIREAAEEEEKENYNGRMSAEWLEDLAPLGTDENKPFLEEAPCLIVVFKKSYDLDKGEKKKNYYVNESVGLACGFLLAAIHQAGLVSLTHTPSPMNFLTKILNRPSNERPYLLIPVGFAREDAQVPDIGKKTLNEITDWY